MIVRKTYQHGGSAAVNLPAACGIRPGTNMIIKIQGKKIILERMIK